MTSLSTARGEKLLTREEKEEEGEEESLEGFLKRHQVRNSEETAKALHTLGVQLNDLLKAREKDIEDVLKEANVGVLSRMDLFHVLRSSPESCVYREFQAKLQGKNPTSSLVVILHPNEHEKMNRVYEKYTQISTGVDKLQTAINNLEGNSNACKTKVKQCYKKLLEELKKYFDSLFIKIDTHKTKKEEFYRQLLNEWKNKESQIKRLADDLTQCMSNSELGANEKRNQVLKMLQNPLIDSIQWKDTLNNNEMVVNTDIQPIVQLVKESIALTEPIELKLEPPQIDSTKEIPLIHLKWEETIPESWKSNCDFEVELLPTENNDNDNKMEEKKSEIENENKNGWKTMTTIKSNKMNKSLNGMELKYKWKWRNTYGLRIRARFFDHLFFTPYSNVQTFYTGPGPFGSSILTLKEAQMLQLSLPRQQESKMCLLYRASRDGFQAQKFHALCDNKGPTVTIVHSKEYNNVFGGFTNISWSPNSKWNEDRQSFLFLLRSSDSTISTPQKWTTKSEQEKYAVYHYDDYGPTFGYGYDLRILDRYRSGRGFSKFGISYDGPRSNTLLAGVPDFLVQDCEVYQVL